MSDSESRFRSYLGLALVIVAYVGGIIGWSCAALTVDSDNSAPDTAQVVLGPEEDDEPELGDGGSAPLSADR